MEILEYEMRVWSLNSIYSKVKNCKIIKPPYEVDSSSSNKFYLDKRDWLILDFEKTWVEIVDDYTIWAIIYYLVKDSGKIYIWYNNAWTLTYITSWENYDSDTPTRFVTGRSSNWAASSTWLQIADPVAWIWWSEFWWDLEWYAWGYVKFQTNPLPAIWDYVTFTSWILTGATNRVEAVDSWYAFIIWTNARWSIPWVWSTLNIYSSTWKSFLIWHTWWVTLYILNWTNTTTEITLLSTDKPIIDLTNHDWNIFALTEDKMYFSRSTFDDNTQFYPLDNFSIDLWYRLFSMWKTLLAFARTNKLFAPASSTSQTLWYVWYDINYNWNLFSKYSTIFSDQTVYILQKDKQLMQVDIVSNNSTAYDINTTNVLKGSRWFFEGLGAWEVNITASDRFLNIIYSDWVDSTNYQYDNQDSHWLINEYIWNPITKIWDQILAWAKVLDEWWTTDNWIEYEQEINMWIFWWKNMYMPYFIRTMFWIEWTDVHLDLNLDIEFEIWWKIDTMYKKIVDYDFENRLEEEPTWDDLLEDITDTVNWLDYTGTTVSIQNWIYRTWRFIRFKFYWNKRFIIWDSYVFTETTKPMINEYLLTN